MRRNLFYISSILFLIIAGNLFSQSHAADTLTINQAIQLTVENHPLIRQATEGINASRANVEVSRSSYYPGVTGEASYSRIGPTPKLNFLGESFSLFPANNYDFHVGANQRVYDFGKRSTAVELAKSGVESASDNLGLVKSNLAFRTIQVFYAILFLQQNQSVLDEEIRALNAHIEVTRKMAETGSATAFEVLTTKVRVADAENRKADVQNALDRQNILLHQLTGIPMQKEIKLSGQFARTPTELNTDSLVSTALNLRPEYQLAKDAITSAEIRQRLASIGDRPDLNLHLLAGLKNGFIPNLNTIKFNWVAGVQLQVPVFNGFRTRYQTQEARANLEAAKAHIQDVQRRIVSEVQQEVANVKASEEKLKTSQVQLEQAREALSMAKTRFEIGMVTNLDLLDAQTSLSQAELNHLRSLYNYVQNRYALENAIGKKLWE